jgi:light-regulated signal transduction histidine kinase (bacteriophytochrome)
VSESHTQISSDRLPEAVSIHARHLQQLFQNLIGNAIKYRSPERTPVIHETAENQSGGWNFAVADNGIGIASEYKENVLTHL